MQLLTKYKQTHKKLFLSFFEHSKKVNNCTNYAYTELNVDYRYLYLIIKYIKREKKNDVPTLINNNYPIICIK